MTELDVEDDDVVEETDEEDGAVTYNYSFFHFTFCLVEFVRVVY